MDTNQQKAQFSIAYVHAVATVAGLKIFRCDVDDESVDITLGRTGGGGTLLSPRLDVQLKCSGQDLFKADGVHFPLKRKNYDDLRETALHVPKILVVVLTPASLGAWISFTADERMCLHRHAWWLSLRGADERLGIDTPSVLLPRAQRFDVEALRDIMDRLGRKELP